MKKEHYQQKLNELVKEEPKKIYREFLMTLKNLFLDYLSDNVDEIAVSDLTAFWYAAHDKFSTSLIEFDERVKDLSAGMDITHPDFSKERKRKIIQELINRINEMLESQS